MTHLTRQQAKGGNKVQHLAVMVFFLCSATVAQAATNSWEGSAYGTIDWSTAPSISSQADGTGVLIIAHTNTTSLTLAHDITGVVRVDNERSGFTVDATDATLTSSMGTVFTAFNATNLTITGGQFIGASGSAGSPPTPTQAFGGWITNSTATISGSEFSGINDTYGFTATRSELTVSNVIFRGGISGIGLVALDDSKITIQSGSFSGGDYGIGLYADDASTVTIHNGSFTGGDYGIGLKAMDNSTVTIHDGSFTGGLENTAFWLLDSDTTISNGTFVGNIGGSPDLLGTGLFSELTKATTNSVNLHGGTFSSLAFQGVDGSIQNFVAGTNLVVQNGILQDGGTVIVDNQSNSALTNIVILSGTMSFPSNTFTLMNGGSFILDGQDSSANFNTLNIASNATMNIGVASIMANAFYADSFSTNLLTVTASTNGWISTQTAWFDTNSVLVVNADSAGMRSVETNDIALISANTNQLFAGASTNNPATAQDFEDNVNVVSLESDRTRFIDLYFDPVNGKTVVKFQFTAMPLKEYWDLTNGTSTVVTEEFADELDLLASSEMLATIDEIGDPAQSLAATEETYFTTMNTFQTVLNGIQAAVGQSASRGAEYREQLKLKPSGARGPRRNNDLRGWAKYYGQRYYHDADGLNREYETSLDGGVIGIDKSIGSLLVGLGGGYGRYSTTADYDAEENITAYHGSLYGTLGLDTAYIDAGIAYGFNEVETRTSSPFVLNGEFDAQIISGYLGGGIDLVDATEGMVFTPEASIQYSMYEQDAYTETSGSASITLPRNIDAFDADSLRGSVGLNVSIQETMKMETFSFKYDIRFHWIREFNPDPGNMNFSLDGGNNDYQLAYPMLDEDVYRAGIGAAFFNTLRNQPKNVLFRIDFDELFGDGFNSHNLTAKVIYAF